MATGVTSASDLLYDPEVARAIVWEEFEKAGIFKARAVEFRDLVGQAGDTITFPYVGRLTVAEDVSEGGTPTKEKLTNNKLTATVSKAMKEIAFYDEAVNKGGQPFVDDGISQMGRVFAEKIDAAFKAAIVAAGEGSGGYKTGFAPTTTDDVMSLEALLRALAVGFGDKWARLPKLTLYVHSYQFADLALDPKAKFTQQANFQAEGFRGNLLGMDVVVSDDVVPTSSVDVGGTTTTVYDAWIAMPTALAYIVKQDLKIEKDRDIETQETDYVGSLFYAVKCFNQVRYSGDVRLVKVRTVSSLTTT